MIDTTIEVFPNNVCSLMVARLKTIDSDIRVFQRPLRESDGTQVIGVFPITWTPDDSTFEMDGQFVPAGQPTVQRYIIGVQSFVQDSDEVQGIKVHSILAKRVRSMLYRDNPLAVGLNTLQVSMDGSTERIQKRGIQVQRFLANEIGGVFMFLSSAEYYVETETV